MSVSFTDRLYCPVFRNLQNFPVSRSVVVVSVAFLPSTSCWNSTVRDCWPEADVTCPHTLNSDGYTLVTSGVLGDNLIVTSSNLTFSKMM